MFNLFKSITKSSKTTKSKIEIFLDKVLTEENIKNINFTHNTISGRDSDYAVKMNLKFKHNDDFINIEVNYSSNSDEFDSLVIDINRNYGVFYLMSYNENFMKGINFINKYFNLSKVAQEYRQRYVDYYNSEEYKNKKNKDKKQREESEKRRNDALNSIMES